MQISYLKKSYDTSNFLPVFSQAVVICDSDAANMMHLITLASKWITEISRIVFIPTWVFVYFNSHAVVATQLTYYCECRKTRVT